MSANDGGPCVAISRAPTPKPHIPRGILSVAIHDPDTYAFQDYITLSIEHANTILTYHTVKVYAVLPAEIVIDVKPDTVVTWEFRHHP